MATITALQDTTPYGTPTLNSQQTTSPDINEKAPPLNNRNVTVLNTQTHLDIEAISAIALLAIVGLLYLFFVPNTVGVGVLFLTWGVLLLISLLCRKCRDINDI